MSCLNSDDAENCLICLPLDEVLCCEVCTFSLNTVEVKFAIEVLTVAISDFSEEQTFCGDLRIPESLIHFHLVQ